MEGNVALVGAGIGGLTAALSLHAAGLGCTIFEAVEDPRPIGCGINLLPHAVRELTELGLGDALSRTGIALGEMVHCDRFGNHIWSAPRGRAAGYDWPQYSIHRGELQRLLLEAVRDRLGPSALRTGLRLVGFVEDAGGVQLRLYDPAADHLTLARADVLVGSDGIHSVVRSQLHPNEGRPPWNGIVMWRGVTEARPFLSGRSMVVAGSNRRAKLVAYPISRRSELRGSALVNWVAEVRVGAAALLEPESWNRRADRTQVLSHFADWSFGWLDAPELISGAEAVYEYPMVDRDPLDSWSTARVTLLGDAAHPMYPVGSNGGSQAILDARMLALQLARHDDPGAALAEYERVRRPQTTALVAAARSMGPERVLALVEERAPHGFGTIEEVLSAEELERLDANYRELTGVDVQALNSRPSWGV